MDPVSTFTTGVHSTVRILEVTYQLKSVDEQTADLLHTTEHVNRNIDEARRLRALKAENIDAKEEVWIAGVIRDTEEALLEVARLIEPARVDSDIGQGANSKTRILWILRDGPKVKDKHRKLAICHQSLTTVISSLHGKDKSRAACDGMISPKEPPPYSEDMAALFNWKCRRRGVTSPKACIVIAQPNCPELGPSSPVDETCSLDLELTRSTSPQLALQPFTAFDTISLESLVTEEGFRTDRFSIESLDASLRKMDVSKDVRSSLG